MKELEIFGKVCKDHEHFMLSGENIFKAGFIMN